MFQEVSRRPLAKAKGPRLPPTESVGALLELTALLFSRLFERAQNVWAATGPVVVQKAGLPASRRSPLHGQNGPGRAFPTSKLSR